MFPSIFSSSNSLSQPHPIMKNPVLFFLTILICSQSPLASSKPPNFLSKGSSLSVEDTSDFLTSPNKTFTCGFYSVGTNAYYFSIWFTNSANKTIVWMANRDQPVNSQGTKISIHGDGSMVLKDIDGTVVWSTNTSKTDVNKAELLETGNLVLTDPEGNHLWQSFDTPTDTLLPSQRFTKTTKLISAKQSTTYSTGYFSFFFNNDNTLRMLYDGPEISSLYWPNPDWDVFQNGRTNYNSSRIGILDDMGRFVASDQLAFNATDMSLGIKRRLTMDYDGNLRLYSLNEGDGSWKVTWQAIQQHGSVHGQCGKYGIFVYTPEPMCSCPPGFEMSDSSDWNKGCKAKFTQKCNQTMKFVELLQTDFYGYDLNYIPGTSFEGCRNSCLGDCNCQAFGYKIIGAGQCYPKSALFNGYKSPSFPGSMYLKLPANVETSESIVLKGSNPTCDPSGAEIHSGSSDMYYVARKTNWAYIYWFVLAVGVIEFFFLTTGWWFLYRKHGMPTALENGYRAISNQFKKFTYAELKKATKNFKEELGRGGSGAVYKGILEDNRVVAVKKLSDVIQGEEEFWAEVSTIGRINHMNLVRMWGFCSEKNHKLLVYEHLENGSLDRHLFNNVRSSNVTGGFLGWQERFKIALGAAKGLAYLHHECLEWVIHCDVKPENILLGFNFEAKIADFGLSKLTQRGGSGSEFSRIRGTKGYMAPEWALNLPITAKVDVYSFGIVLLEMIKGIRLSGWVVENGEEETELTRFLRETKRKIELGEDSWIDDIVDPRLQGNFNRDQAAMVVEVGMSCVEEDRNKRPNLDSVVQSLSHVDDENEERFYSKKML